jgi:hypothetical protein
MVARDELLLLEEDPVKHLEVRRKETTFIEERDLLV